jgi:hypothetical protein
MKFEAHKPRIYNIKDDITLYFAHHEKLCIVDGQIAFMGGLDLCFGRVRIVSCYQLDEANSAESSTPMNTPLQMPTPAISTPSSTLVRTTTMYLSLPACHRQIAN